VSRVTNIGYMFHDATSFNQNLCEDAWVNSKANKKFHVYRVVRIYIRRSIFSTFQR